MDPLTAFSLAGTVIQFVDFSSKILEGAYHAYKSTSGQLSANQELRLITVDVSAVVSKLSSRMRLSAKTLTGEPSEGSELEETLEAICDQAELVAKELLDRLQRLQIEDSVTGCSRVWQSLNQAIRSAWKRHELEALFEKLKVLKQVLESLVLLEFR
jgi:hypothetical protein